jgi:cytochrome P450
VTGSLGRAAPEPRGHPLWRNWLTFSRNEPSYSGRVLREVGGVARIRSLVSDDYLVTDPMVVKHIFVDHPERYDKQGFDYRALGSMFGRGLGFVEGAEWANLHHLAPFLRRAEISTMSPIVAEEVAGLLVGWAAAAGTTVDVEHIVRRLTFRIAGRVMFGEDLRGDADRLLEIFRVVEERADFGRHAISQALSWLPSPTNRRYARAIAELDAFIAPRVEFALTNKPDTLLGRLAGVREEGAPLSRRELRDTVANWIFDATDQFANAVTWTLWLLGTSPDAQDRARREVREVVGDRMPGFDDVSRLPWLRACCQEALRMYPPSHTLNRRALVDDDLSGYRVPTGRTVVVNIHAIHHDARWWPEPEVFEPARFLAGVENRFAYLPFGMGARRCIAAQLAVTEVSTVLAALIRDVRVEPAPGTEVTARPLVTLRPSGGFFMRLDRT